MDLREATAQLFPPVVAVAAARVGEDRLSSLPDEVSVVAAAVPKRRREFLSGRFCAHEVLEALGLDGAPILVGPRREPLWPPGAVGSIAHAGEWSVAVAARAADLQGLGVDVELLEPPLDAAVDDLVRTPAERNRHPGAGKLVFSVKEAVYKCLFPLTRRPLEFEDVDVTLDVAAGTFAADVGPAPESGQLGVVYDRQLTRPGRVNGRFAVLDGYVVSGLCLSAPGP